MGVCFYYLMELDSAKAYNQFSLEALKLQNRENHPEYVISLHNLGNLYCNMSDYKAAEPYLKQVFILILQFFGYKLLNLSPVWLM